MQMLKHNYKNAEDITASRIYNAAKYVEEVRNGRYKLNDKNRMNTLPEKKTKTHRRVVVGVDDGKWQKRSYEENRQGNREAQKNRKCKKVKVIQSSVVLSF